MSTTRKTKTALVTDFRRSQILDAARQSFVARGLAGTTVDGIARTAGVAKGTVYLYFRSKAELLDGLRARYFERTRSSPSSVKAPLA